MGIQLDIFKKIQMPPIVRKRAWSMDYARGRGNSRENPAESRISGKIWQKSQHLQKAEKRAK
jgi:hypothetical protein